jgi:polar amino acid transport system substrate-binding protein
MREVAKRGGGFTYYVWPNPAHSNAEELKLAYVLKVDSGLWLAAGTYLKVKAPIFINESREYLLAFVGGARDFALNTSKEYALKTFNDLNGSYVEGNRYIFAYDFAGNCLALPIQPDFLGVNRINITDSNGVDYIRDMIALAKSGGGFIYYIKPDPLQNMIQGFKLSYVTKVNDAWWLGAGIYA